MVSVDGLGEKRLNPSNPKKGFQNVAKQRVRNIFFHKIGKRVRFAALILNVGRMDVDGQTNFSHYLSASGV